MATANAAAMASGNRKAPGSSAGGGAGVGVAVGAAEGEAGERVYHEDSFFGGVAVSSYRFGAAPAENNFDSDTGEHGGA